MKEIFASFCLCFLTTCVFAGANFRSIKAGPHEDAAIYIDGRLRPIVFEPAAILMTVKLESRTENANFEFPSDWPRQVHFLMKSEEAREFREVNAVLVRQSDEKVDTQGRLLVHYVSAVFRLEPVSKGSYDIRTVYQELSQDGLGPVTVVRGDETNEIREFALQRQLGRAKSWEEVKSIELERIQINPRNLAAWMDLAAGAEEYEKYETAKQYWEKALAVAREIGGSVADSEVPWIQKILELLPAYYADRDHLIIAREGLGGPEMPPKTLALRQRTKPRPPREWKR